MREDQLVLLKQNCSAHGIVLTFPFHSYIYIYIFSKNLLCNIENRAFSLVLEPFNIEQY